jgi:hypothetical protein
MKTVQNALYRAVIDKRLEINTGRNADQDKRLAILNVCGNTRTCCIASVTRNMKLIYVYIFRHLGAVCVYSYYQHTQMADHLKLPLGSVNGSKKLRMISELKGNCLKA